MCVGGVEVLGVDPQRRVQPQRVGREPLAEAGRAAEPARDVLEQLLEAGARAVRGGAKVAAQPTCMCALGPSTARNDASSADSRSVGMRRPYPPSGGSTELFTELSEVAEGVKRREGESALAAAVGAFALDAGEEGDLEEADGRDCGSSGRRAGLYGWRQVRVPTPPPTRRQAVPEVAAGRGISRTTGTQ